MLELWSGWAAMLGPSDIQAFTLTAYPPRYGGADRRKDYEMIIERCKHPRQWFVELATGRIVERPCAECRMEYEEEVVDEETRSGGLQTSRERQEGELVGTTGGG